MVSVIDFLAAVALIASLQPQYRLGDSGGNGFCDCIGLIIGALLRCGKKWNGIHGSNYAARYRVRGGVKKIKSVGDLKPGHLVFKGKENGPDLPKRYHKGKAYYNGDLTDYYHVGVVISVNPLRIRHMTTPTIKIDTSLGKWGYYGECSLVNYTAALPEPSVEPIPDETIATVVATSGKTVNLRVGPSTKRKLVERVPLGSKVVILKDEGDWDRVQYGGKVGYMMEKYLMETSGKEAA